MTVVSRITMAAPGMCKCGILYGYYSYQSGQRDLYINVSNL